MMKNRPIFEPPRFMSNQQAAEQLIQVVNSKDNASSNSLAVLTFDFS